MTESEGAASVHLSSGKIERRLQITKVAQGKRVGLSGCQLISESSKDLCDYCYRFMSIALSAVSIGGWGDCSFILELVAAYSDIKMQSSYAI